MYALKFRLDEHSGYRIEKFIDLPCKIGRGLENTVLVDSDKISGKHATIYQDGENIYIKDDESTNGIIINKKEVTSAPLSNNSSFQLGDIQFQFFIEDMDLDKTVIMDRNLLIPKREIYNSFCKKLYIITTALVIILIAQFVDAIEVGPLNNERWADLALSTLILFVALVVYAGIPSIISRLFSRKFLYPLYFNLVTWTFILFIIKNNISYYLFGLINNRPIISFLDQSTSILLGASAAFLLARFLFPKTKKKIIGLSMGGVASLLVLILIFSNYISKSKHFNYNTRFIYPVWNYDQNSSGLDKLKPLFAKSIEVVDKDRKELLEKKNQLDRENETDK